MSFIYSHLFGLHALPKQWTSKNDKYVTCIWHFVCFPIRGGHLSIEHEPKPGPERKLEDEDLQALLDENRAQTQKALAATARSDTTSNFTSFARQWGQHTQGRKMSRNYSYAWPSHRLAISQCVIHAIRLNVAAPMRCCGARYGQINQVKRNPIHK